MIVFPRFVCGASCSIFASRTRRFSSSEAARRRASGRVLGIEKIFFVEEKTNYDAYGNAHINKQTLITGKGQTKLLDYYRRKDN